MSTDSILFLSREPVTFFCSFLYFFLVHSTSVGRQLHPGQDASHTFWPSLCLKCQMLRATSPLADTKPSPDPTPFTTLSLGETYIFVHPPNPPEPFSSIMWYHHPQKRTLVSISLSLCVQIKHPGYIVQISISIHAWNEWVEAKNHKILFNFTLQTLHVSILVMNSTS